MNPLKSYLEQMKEIRSTGAGVDEISYYGPLEELLNSIGKMLKPKVRCVIQLRNVGAGRPDGGLFSASQSSDQWLDNPDQAPIPDRGAIEIKPPSEDVWETAKSTQVLGYLNRYGLVLVTNYRHFLLVKPDEDGNPKRLGEYELAPSKDTFWAMAAHPGKKEVKEKAKELAEFLKRVMCERAPLYKPEDVAWFLAFYAREALKRIEAKAELPELSSIKEAMEEALGLKFEGKKEEEREKGRHFFRSSLVQTLFYGVFSAWISWHKEDGKGDFNWHEAGWFQHVPVIRALFDKLANPSTLKPLDLAEVLDWAGEALNRVEPEFFDLFEGEHAVQYFYEPFLKAFDPELRKQLGVWYTPPEIVRYMVERVDRALRCELGIDDGLASDRVYVLDPCCGTGAYLVQVLDRIERTLKEKGEGDLWASRLKKAAKERVFGFEILPAPFVVAHLQLGLKLDELGVSLGEDERVGIYLTNALTGWEPPDEVKKQIPIREFQAEREAADHVKQDKDILVVLGNPPYNAFANITTEEEEGLLEPYKEGLRDEWETRSGRAQDLYVRFFRIAEKRIAEMTGLGVVSFISNYSWVTDPVYVILRKHLLNSFDYFWIENMHGDRKISEYAPDGKTSQTIFAIPGFSPGITQGIVVSVWIKNGKNDVAKVFFRNDVNAAKADDRRKQLLETLKENNPETNYQKTAPEEFNRFSFRPCDISANYRTWPLLSKLSVVHPIPGPEESRGGSLLGIERKSLESRMRIYYNPEIDWDSFKSMELGLTKNTSGFDAKQIRSKVQTSEKFQEERIVRYLIRPYDLRWCYWSDVKPLWMRARSDLWNQCWKGNLILISRFHCQADPEGAPVFISRGLFDKQTISRNPSGIPIFIRSLKQPNQNKGKRQLGLQEDEGEVKPIANLSEKAREYLKSLGITNPDTDADTAALIWMHALAIGYSPAYLTENADGIRQDWPRIPLPNSKELLERSAALGRSIAELLDTEQGVKTVTTGSVRPELRVMGVIKHVEGKNLDPDKGHLEITAGWGHPGKAGVTMPGKGRYEEREYTEEERQAIIQGAKALGLSEDEAFNRLGKTTFDIYLNDTAYWRNVPNGVWRYYIGGYQVIKKWLSYREKRMLGRGITIDEAAEVRNMTRRIAAILLIEPQLDGNYRKVKEETYT